MSQKYRFDNERMEFKKITHSIWSVLGTVMKYVLVTASLAVVYYILFSLFINTDSDRKLKRENQMYREMYGQMTEKEGLIGDVLKGLETKDNEIYRQLFNSDAPDLGGLSPNGLLSSVDSIQDKDIVEYSEKKLDMLFKASEKINSDLRKVEQACQSGRQLPPLSTPLESFSYARTGASVGDKINPFYKVPVYHGGLDLISQQGDSVLASADGIVRNVIHSNKGLGNVVEIDHGNGYVTRYAQIENTRVVKGQKVTRGKLIGQVGMSGNSFAPHLHYEVLKDTVRLNPVNFFFASVSPDEYMGMLFMSANTGQSMD